MFLEVLLMYFPQCVYNTGTAFCLYVSYSFFWLLSGIINYFKIFGYWLDSLKFWNIVIWIACYL